jgi:hypothetical protein
LWRWDLIVGEWGSAAPTESFSSWRCWLKEVASRSSICLFEWSVSVFGQLLFWGENFLVFENLRIWTYSNFEHFKILNIFWFWIFFLTWMFLMLNFFSSDLLVFCLNGCPYFKQSNWSRLKHTRATGSRFFFWTGTHRLARNRAPLGPAQFDRILSFFFARSPLV